MKKILIVFFVIFLQSAIAFSQSTTGRLSGVVSTSDGVVPNAAITVRDNQSDKELTAMSKGDGSFLFPQMEVGTYTVTVTVSGFKTYIANEVKIDIGREYSLNPVLEVGNVQESVTISAGADIVNATTAQMSSTVSPQQIGSLPLLQREPIGLAQLQAGVQSSPAKPTTINGMRASMTNITRDGINIQDNYIRTSGADFSPNRPTVDDTAEFTVITGNQESDQGYGGAQIRLVTPRGTKDFHGALFGYNRNSALSANNFFSNRSGLTRPFRNRNQFGGKISGPMPLFNFGEGGPAFLKNKAFFFFAYEKISDPNNAVDSRTILTPEARSGQFRYTRVTPGAAINTTIGTANISCPATTVVNTGTCVVSDILGFARGIGLANIPAVINPIIQLRILSLLPTQSNGPGGDTLNTAGYYFNRSTGLTQPTYTGRIDIDFNERNTINGVYSYNVSQIDRPDLDGSYTVIPEVKAIGKNDLLALAYRRIFSSNFVNEIRGGFSSNDVIFDRLTSLPANFLSLPLISNPENNGTRQGRVVKNYNLQNNVDWIIGKHNLRFGGQLQYFQPTQMTELGITPIITIGTNTVSTPVFANPHFPGGINNIQITTANGLLGLLGGIVTGVQQDFYVNNPEQGYAAHPLIQPYRYANHSLYVSDRWQVSNEFTLTFGIRYELFPALKLTSGAALEPILNADDPISSLLDRNGRYGLIGTNSGVKNAFYKTDYNNFAPSIGFAWALKAKGTLGKLLFDRTILRGGYSRIYGNDQIVTAIRQVTDANFGLGQTRAFVLNSSGNTFLNLRLGADNILVPATPSLTSLQALTFIRNNTPPNSNYGGIAFGVDPNLQTPMVEQYSFGLQREFAGNMAFEIRYVGTRSDNITRGIQVNQIDVVSNGFLTDFQQAAANLALSTAANPTNPAAQTPFCAGITAGCQPLNILQLGGVGSAGKIALPAGYIPTLNARLRDGQITTLALNIVANGLNNHPTVANPDRNPFVNFLPNPAADLLGFFSNEGFYSYHSLQVEFRRRFAQGLYFQANYTFSKNLTDTVSTGSTQFEPYLQNQDRALDKQRAEFDLTHVFNFNGVYQLPFGQGKKFLNQNRIVDKLFGGWELSGIIQAFSGLPITIVNPAGTLNSSGLSGRQTPQSSLTNQQIKELVGIFKVNEKLYFINPNILNTNGQASAGPGSAPFAGQVFFNNSAGQTGNIGRTIFNGPKHFNINAALIKNIRFRESIRLQLRAEAFNLLNSVNFLPSSQLQNINSPLFGQILGAGTPRVMQFGVRFEF